MTRHVVSGEVVVSKRLSAAALHFDFPAALVGLDVNLTPSAGMLYRLSVGVAIIGVRTGFDSSDRRGGQTCSLRGVRVQAGVVLFAHQRLTPLV